MTLKTARPPSPRRRWQRRQFPPRRRIRQGWVSGAGDRERDLLYRCGAGDRLIVLGEGEDSGPRFMPRGKSYLYAQRKAGPIGLAFLHIVLAPPAAASKPVSLQCRKGIQRERGSPRTRTKQTGKKIAPRTGQNRMERRSPPNGARQGEKKIAPEQGKTEWKEDRPEQEPDRAAARRGTLHSASAAG